MPASGGARQASENRHRWIEVYWKPTGTELTTVGPTVYALFQVKAGDIVIARACRVLTLFNGGATFTVGDDGVTDRFFDAGDITEGTVGLYQANAASAATLGFLYTADNTVDVSHTGNAGSTTGEAVLYFEVIETGSKATS